MTSGAGVLLQVLVFPGLLFSAAAGLVASWVDRKLTARLQKRVGPPFLQPVYDVCKLMIKETCVPEGASLTLFLGAPLLGLAGAAVASTIVWRALRDRDHEAPITVLGLWQSMNTDQRPSKSSVSNSLRRLCDYGFAARVKMGTEWAYQALEEPSEGPPERPGVNAIAKQLSGFARRADESLRVATAAEMSRALSRIRDDARALRSSIKRS